MEVGPIKRMSRFLFLCRVVGHVWSIACDRALLKLVSYYKILHSYLIYKLTSSHADRNSFNFSRFLLLIFLWSVLGDIRNIALTVYRAKLPSIVWYFSVEYILITVLKVDITANPVNLRFLRFVLFLLVVGPVSECYVRLVYP